MRWNALAAAVVVVMMRANLRQGEKIEMHMHAVSLHFCHYNFARIHKTLKVRPAMQAGIAGHVWSIEEIVRLVAGPEAKKREPYKSRSAG